MRIRLVGTSHHHAPVEVRERLAMIGQELGPALLALHELPGVREIVVISTCNRFEVAWVDEGARPGSIEEILAARSGVPTDVLDPYLRSMADDDAIRHLFRVCASLDSMVLGESQVLGQVKDAYRAASEAGTVGPLLHRLFHKAFATAKRIRSETGIGASSLSIARAAVDCAFGVFEDLAGKSVLLLGAGEMAELALRAFRDRGCRDLWVSGRTLERAAAIAGPLEAAVVPWARRVEFLATADIVVASTGATEPVISRQDVRSVQKARRGRPLLLVDISVPRNLDPSIHGIDSVYLFDIDDLSRVVAEGQEARKREAVEAEGIVADEVAGFSRVLSQVHVSPLLRALHQKTGRDARTEVERTLGKLARVLEPLGDGGRAEVEQALERMAGAIAKRFLHDPIQRIRALGEAGDVDRIQSAADLLGLEATLLSVCEDPVEAEDAEGPPRRALDGER